MNAKEGLLKIAELLKIKFTEDFTNAKCTDGTILQWTGDLKEGAEIMTVGTDGNPMPAADMTYEIEDGSKITTVGGLVTAIEVAQDAPPEGEGDLAAVKEACSQLFELVKTFEVKFSEMETKLTSYDEKFTAIESTVSNSTKTIDEKFTAIKEVVEAISLEPAAKPIETDTKKFSKVKEISASERIANALKVK